MITAYLKPTNFCNVGCAHCYLPEDVRANKEKMNEETLQKVMDFLKDMKEKSRKKQIFLLWHGGEPLVLSPAYFEKAAAIIDKNFNPDEVIEAVQTSLIPYKREFAPIVHKRWRSEVGSSMDFSSRLIKQSAKEYQHLWMKKVDMAREDDILIIPSITPTRQDCGQAAFIYQWFRDRSFYVWNIDRYSNIAGTLPEFSTNAEHAHFLKELFEAAFSDYETTCYAAYIKPLAAAIGGIVHDAPGDRWGGSCQSDFVVINPDGKLNNCPDKDSFEPSYGNLFEGFSSFQNSSMRKKWIRIQQAGHRIDECSSCEYASWCRSGCPITGNACTAGGVRDECSGFKSFLNYVRDFMNSGAAQREFCLAYLNRQLLPQGFASSKTIKFAN